MWDRTHRAGSSKRFVTATILSFGWDTNKKPHYESSPTEPKPKPITSACPSTARSNLSITGTSACKTAAKGLESVETNLVLRNALQEIQLLALLGVKAMQHAMHKWS